MTCPDCNNESLCGNYGKSFCDPNSDTDPNYQLDSFGSRGVTYWGSIPSFTLDPNQTQTINFTCTEPECKSTQYPRGVCNIIFHAYSNSPSSPDTEVHLQTKLNSGGWGNVYFSKVQNHGIWHAADMATIDGYLEPVNNNPGQNSFTIWNKSNNTQVKIEGFQIQRIYGICNLGLQVYGCTGGDCDSGAAQDSSSDTVQGVDCPCNFDAAGGKSFTTCSTNDFYCGDPVSKTLAAGQCHCWTFDWSSYTSSHYKGSEMCLFNFNNVCVADDQNSNRSEIQLDAYLNGNHFFTYYLSKTPGNPAPLTFDLTKAEGYNDTGQNHVTLVNNSDVSVIMTDHGGINVYRTYQTEKVALIRVYSSTGGYVVYRTPNHEYPDQSHAPTWYLGASYGQAPTFMFSPSTGWHVSAVYVNGVSVELFYDYQDELWEYTFQAISSNDQRPQILSAFFSPECGNCETICESCYDGWETCAPCYGYCQTCVLPCELCESGYQWPCEICESCYTSCESCYSSCATGCEVCEETCQVSCQTACDTTCQSCFAACQDVCQTTCQSGCQGSCQQCYTGCYDSQCEPPCYACVEGCYACEDCYGNYT